MFDLVWLGNYIVPRWEAIAILGLIVVVWLVAAGFIVAGIGYAAKVVIVGFWRCTNLLIQIRDKK